jgi:hypothetical protein
MFSPNRISQWNVYSNAHIIHVKPILRVYVVFDGIANTQLPCVVDWKHQFYNDHSYVGMSFNVCEFSVDVSINWIEFYDWFR